MKSHKVSNCDQGVERNVPRARLRSSVPPIHQTSGTPLEGDLGAQMCELLLNANSCPTVRSARSRVLCRVGYQVIEAANDAEILRLAPARKPDLIVIDGPTAGTDLSGLLRANPATE